MSRTLSNTFEEALTDIDAQMIDRFGESEECLVRLACEHAARAQALLRCSTPRMQRISLMMICKHFLKDADNVDVSPTPEALQEMADLVGR